ncbi:bidirectional sugar transporter SWEET4-like [Argentina anserina]|uniref:bidirectional sugar transporter SWEET4-like n=1 Tax=Argentina anserina TaxID=57926 RepID=UPI0021768E3C|nr:bidirectional sugar transporter SWEET4-like [Potentilla anserina]XP_050375849.1 bidirectional sugar transporter SWEET4-like [Potentilla anserina]
MVSADAARTVVGIIGNLIAFFLFLSPVPTFVQIWKKGSVEQYSPVPYLATLINCMVWTLYGLPIVHPDSTLVWTINGLGTIIEVVYIILFLIFSDKKKRLIVVLVVAVEIIFIGVLTLLVLTLAHTHTKRSLIVGIISIAFNIMMYAAPMTVMKMVITTKSVEYMPFFLSFTSFANGLAWTAYALIRFDPFITIPNGLGTFFGLAQLILYATYYKSTQRLIAERKGREVNLSEVTIDDNAKKIAGRTTQYGDA